MTQMTLQQAFDLALKHYQAGQLPEAESIYRQLVQAAPQHADSAHMLGMILLQLQRMDEALPLIETALRLNPDSGQSHCLLATAHVASRRYSQALEPARRAIALIPELAEAHQMLGIALLELGDSAGAVQSLRRAVSLRQDLSDAWHALGRAFWAGGDAARSIDAWRKSLQLRPDFAEAHNNLGVAYKDAGDLDRAMQCFNAAIRFGGSSPEAYANLGNALKDQARLPEALEIYRKAISVNPASQPAWSNLLYGMTFDLQSDAAAIAQECERWDAQIARPLRASIDSYRNSRDPERKLRIGYVSPDFYAQSESFFVLPLLGAHDRERFEIHCYSSVRKPDDVTQRIKSRADVWHEVLRLSDEQLASKIREDGIDILIDLTMQMSENRILTFARKPSPVQIAWLAYPGTTGLKAIDYRITDRWMDAEDSDQSWSAEEAIRLPDSWCVYEPLEPPMPVAPLPALRNGFITFGSMNNFCKTGPAVLELWAKTLARIPQSRLILACPAGSTRTRITQLFSSQGVTSDRLTLIGNLPRVEYLRMYDQIDICLDPFPYNGITTTCDALLKGVPVLTLPGSLPQTRAGLSMLANVGLMQFVASSAEHFIQLASEHASQLDRLAAVRESLCAMMLASPLMDAKRFAANMEAAYRTAWRKYCGK